MRMFIERAIKLQVAIFIFLVFSGCTPPNESESSSTSTPASLIPSPTVSMIEVTPTQYLESLPDSLPLQEFGLTYQQTEGNRYVSGSGNLPAQNPLDITLPGVPTWVVATPYKDGIIWYVTLENGDVHAYLSSPNGISSVPSHPAELPPGMPPLLHTTEQDAALVTAPNNSASRITHPVWLPQTNYRASILSNGDVEIIGETGELISSLPVNALPDARLLIDENERILLLTDPTNRYNHGVLGDNLEAASITLIETLPKVRVSSKISLPQNEVVEGIAPIWVDLTGNGQREIVVTISDLNLGAGIVVFSETGERLAEGSKMGQPYRWRHQIAAAEFLTGEEPELAVVRTPHIGGVIEFYRLEEGNLNLVAELPGVTSHVMGSRNLDMSAAGDFDGDGSNELLVLDPSLSELIAVQRTADGAEFDWVLPIEGTLSTNLAAVTLPDGDIALGLGRTDGVLRIWVP